jgi:hypothetical protein
LALCFYSYYTLLYAVVAYNPRTHTHTHTKPDFSLSLKSRFDPCIIPHCSTPKLLSLSSSPHTVEEEKEEEEEGK